MGIRTYLTGSQHLERDGVSVPDYEQPYSVSMWIRHAGFGGSDYFHIWDLGYDTSAEANRDTLNLYIIGGPYFRIVRRRSGSGTGVTSSTTLVSATTWYYIGLQASSTALTLYLNGQQTPEVTQSQSASGAVGASDHLNLGAYIPSEDQTWNGQYSNVKVWQGLLSSGDFAREMHSWKPVTHLQELWSWWPMYQGANLIYAMKDHYHFQRDLSASPSDAPTVDMDSPYIWANTKPKTLPKFWGVAFEAPTGPTIYTGTAALTGTGTLTSSGTVPLKTGAATLAGTGTLTAAGTVVSAVVTGTAALTGLGTLTAAGTRIRLGTATLSGLGSLTATGTYGTWPFEDLFTGVTGNPWNSNKWTVSVG